MNMSPISPSIPQPNRYISCGGHYEIACGVVELQGARANMEDTTRVQVTQQSAFFGVYDGHGGAAAADFCSDHLHVNLGHAISAMWLGTPLLDSNDQDCVRRISQCVRDAFVWTDRQFLDSQYQHQGGTTACVAVLINDTVVVGNVGDSRAVLCRNNVAVPLSRDHTPARLDEVERIRAAGGEVDAGDVVVGGEEFSLTRAIGDCKVKVPPGRDYHDRDAPQVVTSEPEVSIISLGEQDRFFVIASDGIWDKMSDTDVVQFVTQKLLAHGDPQMAASELAHHAIMNLRSCDNVSAVIVVPRMLPRVGRIQLDDPSIPRRHPSLVQQAMSPHQHSHQQPVYGA